MTVEQAKEFQAVATKAAEDVSKPIKTAFEKALKDTQGRLIFALILAMHQNVAFRQTNRCAIK